MNSRVNVSILSITSLLLLGTSAAALAGQASAAVSEPANWQLEATLVANRLSVDWADVSSFDRFVVVDEHLGSVAQASPTTSFTRTLGGSESASLLVFGSGLAGTELLGKVQAIQPTVGSPIFSAVAVSTGGEIHLDWEPVPGVSSWSVAGPAGDRVLDAAVTELDVPGDLSVDQTVDIVGQTVVDGVATRLVTGFAIAPPLVTASSVDGGETQGDTVPGSVVSVKASRFQYDTYIPYPFIDAPDSAVIPMDCDSGNGSDYWYAGDDHGEVFNHSRFRTRAVNQYTWGTAMITSKNVSPTKRYIKNGVGGLEYESSKQASDATMSVRALSMEGGKASGAIAHSIGNPYCHDANNIDYRQTHDVYRTGGYTVSGWHDKMPNHFFYRRNFMSDGTVVTSKVFHHALKDPKCLNTYYQASGACPAWEYQYTR